MYRANAEIHPQLQTADCLADSGSLLPQRAAPPVCAMPTHPAPLPVRVLLQSVLPLQKLPTRMPVALKHPMLLLWMSISPHTRLSAMLPLPSLDCSLAIPKPFFASVLLYGL